MKTAKKKATKKASKKVTKKANKKVAVNSFKMDKDARFVLVKACEDNSLDCQVQNMSDRELLLIAERLMTAAFAPQAQA